MDKNQFQMRVKLKSGLIGRAAYYCEDTVSIVFNKAYRERKIYKKEYKHMVYY